MDQQERTNLLYRIIQGKLVVEDYTICTPSFDILVDAQLFYNKIIEDYKYEPWITKDQCLRTLIYNGIWSDNKDRQLEQLNKDVEETKIQIYKSFFNQQQKEYHKLGLEILNEEITELEELRHSLDYLTLSGFTYILQQQYILTKTVYIDNKLVFDNFDNANFNLLNHIQNLISSHTISISMYRELARNEPWVSCWRTGKDNVFGVSGVYLSGEQRYLILYTKMYDSVAESTEEPPPEVMEDDDALDGWFLVQKRKREDEKKKNVVESTLNIPSEAQEVFLPARTPEDIVRIENMNTIRGKIIKRQRSVVIKQVGEIADSKLPDQQLLIHQQAMEQFKNRGK